MRIPFINRKRSSETTPQPGKAVVVSISSSNRGLDFLVELFQRIRPATPQRTEDAALRFQALLFQLQEDRSLLFSLRKALLSQFVRSDITLALTESGLLSSRGFIQELSSKLKHKLLPVLLPQDDFLFVIERLFYKKDDYVWMEKMNPELWVRFFELIGIQVNLTEPVLIKQLTYSLRVLSHRLAMMGLEKEVAHRYQHTDDAVFPFLEQNRLVNLLAERKLVDADDAAQKLILESLKEALHNCLQSIRWLKDQRLQHGTSLAETFLYTRMEQHVQRMFLVVDALDTDNSFDTYRFVQYLLTVVRNQNRKNSVGEFLSQNLGLLAYQISEHGGRRGEVFITATRREFVRLFRSAMGGGFIISFIAIFKNLLGNIGWPAFWQGILYSINYSTGFMLIQSTGSTLATKQPAFTASSVAASLDSNKHNGQPNLQALAITVSQVSRSQIASFAGNLLLVFPITYLLAYLYDAATGNKIATGEAATQLLQQQHPYQSLALIYACFTGFFLFLSGIIAGWVENYVAYAQLGRRVQLHPFVKHNLGARQQQWLVRLFENNLGSIAGSISLGFFLGMASFVGKTLAIPFDIRHITIAAGNVAIGVYGLDNIVEPAYLALIVSGVLLIGFLNFLVSFGLAFYVAVKSRGIRLKDYPEFMGILWQFMRRYPLDFFWPPRQLRTPGELNSARPQA